MWTEVSICLPLHSPAEVTSTLSANYIKHAEKINQGDWAKLIMYDKDETNIIIINLIENSNDKKRFSEKNNGFLNLMVMNF